VDEVIDGVRVRRFVFALPRMEIAPLLNLPVVATTTLRELRARIRAFEPDVLHVQCFSGNGAYSAAMSRLTGIPLVISLQGETVMDDHDIYDRSIALRAALRSGLRRARAVTGCSRFVLEDARDRFGLDMRKALVIVNGVDVGEAAPAPGRLPFPRYVLGLGRVVHKKGFDLLLEAFGQVADKHPTVALVIAGDGTELGRLRQRAKEIGLAERVHLPGRLAREEVATAMRGADVFVMPSRVEPFGMVVLEAWRAGVAVVVTRNGGAPEFVTDGVSGLVVDPLETTSLASALDSLLESSSLRARLGEAGRSELPRFAWDRVAKSYELVYREVTAGV
jgi:glycosyltransferase involved in cell wall biosynthesis